MWFGGGRPLTMGAREGENAALCREDGRGGWTGGPTPLAACLRRVGPGGPPRLTWGQDHPPGR